MSRPVTTQGQRVQSLQAEGLDLLIVGGGIVGAGIARDAALRGLRTGLVEQHDIAYGTSSRSSRLLHGGLRYLAQGRIGLVREASIEKQILHRIAPHLSDPLAFVFPSYRNTGWPFWKLRLGVKVYDLLCGGKNLGRSSALSPARTLELVPALRRQNLSGAVRYFDGFTNDARLVIDTLRSAAAEGALVSNYTRFEDASRKGEEWICEVTDRLEKQRLEIRARAVVNATGPWAAGIPHSSVRLRLTKGVHVTIDRALLPVPDAVVMTEGSRILFVIPWGERVILGTTDTDYEGCIEAVKTEPEDVEHILRVTNFFFPEARILPRHVISTWAGLRPLIAGPSGEPSDISRSHQLQSPEPGWWDVAGGKLTTYRLMAEQTVDRIVCHLNRSARPCATAREELLPSSAVEGLSGIACPPFRRSAVEHYCRNEWAAHLDDVMIRRTGWHYYFPEALAQAETVAEWMAEILQWPETRRQAEVEEFKATHSISKMATMAR